MTTATANHDTPATESNDPWTATDGSTWELGPDPADAEWWAEQGHDGPDDGPEPDWDALADESAATDAHERGLTFA